MGPTTSTIVEKNSMKQLEIQYRLLEIHQNEVWE